MTVKKDLVKNVAGKVGLSQAKTQEVVEETFEAIIEALTKGDSVKIAGFGTFNVARKQGTFNGKEYDSKRVTFKQGTIVKGMLND